MLIAILIVLNIPIYLLIGWLVFDTKEEAAETLWESIVLATQAIIEAVFIPWFFLLGTNQDNGEGSTGFLRWLGFLFACGAVVYGEYYLITRFLFSEN